MRRVTDVDTNIDIGQGLHVGSVAKEKKGLVLDREVEIEGDEEELAPKFLNFIFFYYFLEKSLISPWRCIAMARDVSYINNLSRRVTPSSFPFLLFILGT